MSRWPTKHILEHFDLWLEPKDDRLSLRFTTKHVASVRPVINTEIVRVRISPGGARMLAADLWAWANGLDHQCLPAPAHPDHAQDHANMQRAIEDLCTTVNKHEQRIAFLEKLHGVEGG